ncbi:MAG: oxidoreductase [Acidimicrobiaceae bacterium]|nr:oxidoreductase [Acidimicrobiaceae bacterium]
MFGPPADRAAAISLLREAVEHGVDHIDTAEYYGPVVVNELIREALHPYPSELVLVSKVGAARGRRGEIFAADQPDQLRRGIVDNLKSLGVDTLAAVNLRVMRASAPDAFFDDQLQAMVSARDDGLIGGVRLSNISLDHLEHALRFVDVACVQNEFNPVDRASQSVLEECRRRDIAFVPFAPLGFGSTSVLRNPVLARAAARLGCTPAQACLSWELEIAPNVLLIPGTSSRHHLLENLEASRIHLDSDALHSISQLHR